MQGLHRKAKQKGIDHTIGLTIPETKYEQQMAHITEKRQGINQRLLAELPQDKSAANVYFVDIAKLFPQPKAGQSAEVTQQCEVNWHHDGLHMTADGYSAVGAAIFDHIVPLLPSLLDSADAVDQKA